ncbi:MAG TPA: hypothetical protein VJ794_07760, partial [Gemmatimonadales bacterium]|nr:hypothetical protein [Gemmatimonadales bacterium]
VLDGVPPGPPAQAPATAQPRRSYGQRSSGIVAPAGGARSREKMVWEWPDIADRMLEDWR